MLHPCLFFYRYRSVGAVELYALHINITYRSLVTMLSKYQYEPLDKNTNCMHIRDFIGLRVVCLNESGCISV